MESSWWMSSGWRPEREYFLEHKEAMAEPTETTSLLDIKADYSYENNGYGSVYNFYLTTGVPLYKPYK